MITERTPQSIDDSDAEMIIEPTTQAINIVQKGDSDAIETDKEKVESYNHDNISEDFQSTINDEKASEMNGAVDQNVNEVVETIGLNEKTETAAIKENQIEFNVSNAMHSENADVSMHIGKT